MQRNDTASALAAHAVADAFASLDTKGQPEAVKELAAGFHGDLREAIDTGRQLESDYKELVARADLLPRAGLDRLHLEAKSEAHQRASASLSAARQKVEMLQRAGRLGALPTVDPAREALGRSELEMVIGSGTADQLALRVSQVASGGSRDAIAAMNSEWGRAMLTSRGLEGTALDEAMASAKHVIAATALDNPGRHTDRELAAARLYRSAGELASAIAACSFYMGHIGLGAL